MTTDLRHLPLESIHLALGAHMSPFAGWEMPLRYRGELAEHMAVRKDAGVFDISHMGRFRVRGPDAGSAIASLVTRDPRHLDPGRSAYCLACNDDGGIIDDLIVYRLADDDFLIICNAANAGHIGALLLLRESPAASITDLQPTTALLAVQGPAAVERVTRVLGPALAAIGPHACAEVDAGGSTVFASRTGYTGEDGFEILLAPQKAAELFQSLLNTEGVTPCGLAARDSLRLESSLPLHGVDIDESTSPWEAGLGWTIELDHDFTGRAALERLKDEAKTRLACIVSDGRGSVFRSGQAVYDGEDMVARVASGGFSPMLERSVAMAYLPRAIAREGAILEIDIRGRRTPARTVRRPFYKRPATV